MGYVIPSISDFKTYFVRDFVYGISSNTVTDADITNAMILAGVNFNVDLWGSQQAYTVGYLYLSAHYLVMNLRGSQQGQNGSFSWLINSKAVGNVSEGISIPQRILDNPELAWLSKTYYGLQYLMMILPQLMGNVVTVCGTTLP